MNIRRIILALLTIGAAFGPLAAEDGAVWPLTLDEAIARALKNNLDIAVESYNPELAEGQLFKARETFLPQFDLSFGDDHRESPSYWWLQGEGTSIDKYRNYSAGIAQMIPTGGRFSLSFQGYRSETNQSFQLINPRFGTTLAVSFSQPLLKDFGLKIARRQILEAENSLEIADVQLRGAMMETIYLVQEAYWNFVYAVDSLQVKRQSLELGRDLLAKNKKEVEFGQLAPIEILNAEAAVAQREADLIQAEAMVTRSREVLKTILNLPAEAPGTILEPVDRPVAQGVSLSLDEALKQAAANRTDLQALRKTIDNKSLSLEFARNQMLPALNFEFSYMSPGISGDRIKYLDDNPMTGIIIGKEPGSAGDATKDAARFRYSNWSVGLTLSFPLGHALTRADAAVARIDLAQSEARLKSLERQVALDVADAVRAVETDAKRIEAYRLARELAEKSLEAEQKKLAVGMSTNYFVLDFQDRLANARSLELKAKIDYILSVERLEKATGMSLVRRGVRLP
ncbi:MAG: TolC family protein [Acidobacteria bacterium]|nr:TolC family protein [Acidobacteriota bacterium]OQB58728.1 MAG: Outer membrane protein TolC precursor [Candidatus Aminicenantes bacterium ADurb.Bin147]HNQ80338.1 TolC family protein [Candidatus Aminicenantes bacterium]NMD10359.1 TolC family protein [Acidobacteriota bacterium]HNT31742.1 TolC family protein [Candidatus Aminicenantes bacterium]